MSIDYLMESDEEALRLELKTDAAVVQAQATLAGLKPGMRVADICCGAGLTTAILGGMASPGGHALGIDASSGRIQHARTRYGQAGSLFECRDIREDLSDLGKFDFVWVRFVLEYFKAEAFDVVRNLGSIVADGGILCLIDLDHNSLNHYGLSDRLEKALRVSIAALEDTVNFDPYAGRKLYSHLYRLGYTDIQADVGAHHLIYGPLRDSDAFNWLKKIEVVHRRTGFAIPGYGSAAEFSADFEAFFTDPGRFTYTPVINCWGQLPRKS
ncbi:MAG: methyltransferase type 11 [Spirochaetes bacterium RIFOXYC1_FULL_54_7]|nr:MAG: methyltransferase type 11 [Spirochaetes bacterium RIFOXYC1_FULL_54_7]